MPWTKPSLGLVEYQGSKSNNILFRQLGPAGAHWRVHGTGVFLDHGAPPEARVKAVSQGIWQGKTPPHRIAGMVSADGLRWTRCAEPICDIPADSEYSCFFDPGVGRYLLYGRVGGRGRAVHELTIPLQHDDLSRRHQALKQALHRLLRNPERPRQPLP